MIPRILLAPSTGVAEQQLLRSVGNALAADGKFSPVVWIRGTSTTLPLVPFELTEPAVAPTSGADLESASARETGWWKRCLFRMPLVRLLAAIRDIRARLADLEAMLHRERPAVVFIGSDHNFWSYLLAEAARRQGIPSVGMLWAHTAARSVLTVFKADLTDSLVNGLASWERWLARLMALLWSRYAISDRRGRGFVVDPVKWLALLWLGVRPRRLGGSGGLTDVYLVPGQAYKDILVSDGSPENKVIVVGNPLTDDLYRRAHSPQAAVAKQTVCREFGFEASSPLVVLATSYRFKPTIPAGLLERNLELVVDLLFRVIPNAQIIIKLHPAWQEHLHHLRLDQHRCADQIAVVRDYNLTSLILACDLWVCGPSTTALQAIAGDKLVIAHDLELGDAERPLFETFRQIEGLLYVNGPDEFLEAVRNSLHDDGTRRKLALGREHTRRTYLAGCQGSQECIRAVCHSLLDGRLPDRGVN